MVAYEVVGGLVVACLLVLGIRWMTQNIHVSSDGRYVKKRPSKRRSSEHE